MTDGAEELYALAREKVSGIYLGIDGLNMPNGTGIELGCSRAHKVGGNRIDFIYACETYCDDLPLASLGEFYQWFYGELGLERFKSTDGTGDALHVEYPICLGVSALVLRDALREVDIGALVGHARERCFAFGFHDGDILRLGRATAATGFVCDATFKC